MIWPSTGPRFLYNGAFIPHLYSCLQPILYLNTVIFSAGGLHALTMSLQDPGEENIKLSHARTVLAELEESRRRGKLVDSVIQGAGQVRVQCHRLVLTAVSSVLRDAVMETEDDVTIILVPDLSHEEVETFVQLIYTGVAKTEARSSRDPPSSSGIMSPPRTWILFHRLWNKLLELGIVMMRDSLIF